MVLQVPRFEDINDAIEFSPPGRSLPCNFQLELLVHICFFGSSPPNCPLLLGRRRLLSVTSRAPMLNLSESEDVRNNTNTKH